MDPIKLTCRGCGLKMNYDRDIDPSIPANVVAIDSLCEECVGGDFGEEFWLDADGREVSQDVNA